MTPRREAAELRDLARALLAIEERVASLTRIASPETEDILAAHIVTLAVVADSISHQANDLAPAPFVPTLFQWARGLNALVTEAAQ